MEQLKEYDLTLIVIDDEYHLYDLISCEVYEKMTLEYIKQLLDMWNKRGKYFHNYGIIVLSI